MVSRLALFCVMSLWSVLGICSESSQKAEGKKFDKKSAEKKAKKTRSVSSAKVKASKAKAAKAEKSGDKATSEKPKKDPAAQLTQWNIEKTEIPFDKNPTEKELAQTRFWNYLEGPETKDDVLLKNGHLIRQVGYNVEFIDFVGQPKGAPFLLFKSHSCRGACGGGFFYVVYSPGKKDYFEFPLQPEGYIHEDGELNPELSKHLWQKAEAFYGDCGKYKNSIVVYKQERECQKCPKLHELRHVSIVAGGAMEVDMKREQGAETPAEFKKILDDMKGDKKKKRCKVLPTL